MQTISQQLPTSFSVTIKGINYSLQQMQYPQDMHQVYNWMHAQHVIPQWQLNEPMPKLSAFYEKMLADDHQRVYLIKIENRNVGYVEIYEAKRDRLSFYYDADINDLGWHLLLGETDIFGHGYLRPIVYLISDFIFSYSQAIKIVGEPDKNVKPYAKVATDMGYIAQGELEMPEKTAMLYFCDREDFYEVTKSLIEQ